uniref:Uncharacterized protein n=1 Tax=Nelumbo nucifera TaxID=4432 RepID=A0A822YUL8_NELNU|nr:TPA_asm: hypothetical protein HUJ06_008425 [Nelumbo nucifera]
MAKLCGVGELFNRIIQRRHYSKRKAAELTKISVGVVEACHSLGVMHRDLKPENFLLVNKDNDFDFDLSVLFKPSQSQVFMDVGCLYYVAPKADVDNSGTIDYGELIAAIVNFNKPKWEENLIAIFSYFEKDGSGYIIVDER